MKIFAGLLALFLSSWSFSAHAVESPVVHSEHVEATLVSEVARVTPGKPFTVALRLRMAPHWHTYWQNPGDAGLETKIAWTLPAGFTAGPIEWPAPQLISQPPLMSYGYENEVWLLTEITPPATVTGPVELKARADWLECSDVCIPGRADLTLKIVGKGEIDPRFASAREALPKPFTGKGTIAIDPDGPWYRVTMEGGLSNVKDVPLRFLPFQTGLIDNASPQPSLRTSSGASWQIKRDANAPELPEKVSGVLVGETPAAQPVAWQVELKKVAPTPIAPEHHAPFTLLVLISAFLGGMILNLMPCVLPVLALKVLALVGPDREEGTRKGLWHGLEFTAGVLVSFWALAGLLILLRDLGGHLGWGFQLQSPPFVVLMAALFVLVGLNLFGVFEIGVLLAGWSGSAASNSGKSAGFVSGVLAVLVATPCTAPFMGSALGLALSQPAWVAFLIFTALGLGLAAPYLILAANPNWLRFVPKPGVWMEAFKQFLGFPMLATAVWLVWVYGNQVGLDGAVLLMGALLIVSLACWIYGRWGGLDRPFFVRAFVTLLAALIVGTSLSLVMIRHPKAAPAAKQEGMWQPYSADRIKALQAEGKPVFIDFTATWCLSCQVNQRVALDQPEVMARFKEAGVTCFKADWTSSDPAITAALASYGRQSVPLYVLYGRDPDTKPQILPEILTPGIVLKALDVLTAPDAAEPSGAVNP